jgi:putative tryptophan/tyrosine transport system substrate-binding protein
VCGLSPINAAEDLLMIRRRDFITFLGGAAAWPLAARAQQPGIIPVIGFLDPTSPDAYPLGVAEFRQGLKEAGYVEGRNVTIEYRWAEGQLDRLPRLAADLVARRVAMIVASGASDAALAAKAATSTIPIVYSGGADPVKYGLVASLNRPGGNITGVTSILNEVAGKRLALLRELVPKATTVGYLVGNQSNETQRDLTSDLLAAARALGRQVIVLECRDDSDFEAAFATLVQRQPSALLVSAFPLAFNNRPKILALAARHKIPAIYAQPQYVWEGGLMSYDGVGSLRQIGSYFVPQILKGAKPADLPVQQPTKFRLLINARNAEALGLTIPPNLLALADEVIE